MVVAITYIFHNLKFVVWCGVPLSVSDPSTAVSVWVESPKGKIKEGDSIELHCHGNGNNPSSLISIKHAEVRKSTLFVLIIRVPKAAVSFRYRPALPDHGLPSAEGVVDCFVVVFCFCFFKVLFTHAELKVACLCVDQITLAFCRLIWLGTAMCLCWVMWPVETVEFTSVHLWTRTPLKRSWELPRCLSTVRILHRYDLWPWQQIHFTSNTRLDLPPF